MERSRDSKAKNQAIRRNVSNRKNITKPPASENPGLAGEVMRIQRTIGNQGVIRLLRSSAPQGSLEGSTPITPSSAALSQNIASGMIQRQADVQRLFTTMEDSEEEGAEQEGAGEEDSMSSINKILKIEQEKTNQGGTGQNDPSWLTERFQQEKEKMGITDDVPDEAPDEGGGLEAGENWDESVW